MQMTSTKAPMYPAKVWGETCAELLHEAMPTARGEILLLDMERRESNFRAHYSDWPDEGVDRAVAAFYEVYRKAWERLTEGETA